MTHGRLLLLCVLERSAGIFQWSAHADTCSAWTRVLIAHLQWSQRAFKGVASGIGANAAWAQAGFCLLLASFSQAHVIIWFHAGIWKRQQSESEIRTSDRAQTRPTISAQTFSWAKSFLFLLRYPPKHKCFSWLGDSRQSFCLQGRSFPLRSRVNPWTLRELTWNDSHCPGRCDMRHPGFQCCRA